VPPFPAGKEGGGPVALRPRITPGLPLSVKCEVKFVWISFNSYGCFLVPLILLDSKCPPKHKCLSSCPKIGTGDILDIPRHNGCLASLRRPGYPCRVLEEATEDPWLCVTGLLRFCHFGDLNLFTMCKIYSRQKCCQVISFDFLTSWQGFWITAGNRSEICNGFARMSRSINSPGDKKPPPVSR